MMYVEQLYCLGWVETNSRLKFVLILQVGRSGPSPVVCKHQIVSPERGDVKQHLQPHSFCLA